MSIISGDFNACFVKSRPVGNEKKLYILNNDGIEKGKKLGFICQEIGREINTIGSKANNSEIQSKVVEMKTSLEKIREQVLNIV